MLQAYVIKEFMMVKDYKTMYKRLCLSASEYDKGVISKNEFAKELSYFILYKLDNSVNPYLKKIEDEIERIIVHDRA